MNKHQKIVDAYFAEIGETYWPVTRILNKIVEEINEASEELCLENFKKLKVEVGDLIFAICCLGNKKNIPLEFNGEIQISLDNHRTSPLRFLHEVLSLINPILKKNFFENLNINEISIKSYSFTLKFSKECGIDPDEALGMAIVKFRTRWEAFKKSTDPNAKLSDFK